METMSWSWVEKMKVEPRSALIRFINSMICWLVLESRLAVGSSASTMEGWVTSARAMATRWRWPPDSSLGRWRRWSASPTCSISSSTRRRFSTLSRLLLPSSSGNSTFSYTLSTGTKLNDWKMKPMWAWRRVVRSRSLRVPVAWPSTVTVPAVGVSMHPIRLRIVVLPQPDGPAMEMNSPRSIDNVTPRTAGTVTLPRA